MAENRLDKAALDTQQADIVAKRTAGADEGSMDVLNSVLNLEAARDYNASRDANVGDVFKSKTGIATGIAALLAAAFGGAEGAQAAAGAVQGFGQGAAQNVEGQRQDIKQDTAIAQKDLDTARNSLNMIYQAAPESFLDATGEMMVDSNVLGYALTGLPISISPATARQLKTGNGARDLQIKAAHTAFIEATDVEGRLTALKKWNGAAKLQWSDPEMESMAGAKSLDGFFMKIMPYSDVGTVLDAMLATNAAGITDMADDRLVPIMNGISARAVGASGKVPQKWEVAGNLITSWVMEDFANRSTLSPADQVEQALATNPDLLLEMQSRYDEELYPGAAISIKDYAEMYSSMIAKAVAASGNNPEIFEALVGNMDWAITALQGSVDNQVTALQADREAEQANDLGTLMDHGQASMDDILGSAVTLEDFTALQNYTIKVYGISGVSTGEKQAMINDFLRNRQGK